MEVLAVAVGGLLIALVLFHLQRRTLSRIDPFESISTDVINVARIRVAGIGGLGLVAMAAVVAFAVPSIGVPLAISAVLGVVMAVLLIVVRHRTGPMPSSGRQAGANTTLSIDAPPAPLSDRSRPVPKSRAITQDHGA